MKFSPGKRLPLLLFLFPLLVAGCGGGSTNMPPPTITFTSAPVSSAEEGVAYSYQLAAASSNFSPISFSLTGPSGATLSGNTVSWTPTHAESRTSNAFAVTAATAAGGRATQSWTVTPNGIVNITAVTTYWTPSGSINISPQWIASNPFPAALVPQSDGSLQRLQGAANADGSFSIPDVPAGFYWLQINPNANYWTSTSDFDDGVDVVGHPLATIAPTPTTFNISVSGLQATPMSPSFLLMQSDLRSFLFPFGGAVLNGSTTFTLGPTVITSNIDWSQISTVYIAQHEFMTSGSFTGYALGPAQTLSNVSITNGSSNSIAATLSASPAASLPLAITGTAWALAAQNIGPGAPALTYSDYAAYVQPFLTDHYEPPSSGFLGGPDLTLLRPAPSSNGLINTPPLYGCSGTPLIGPAGSSNIGQPPIVTDVDYGTLSYGDPYPANWQRLLQYCQVAILSLPRPNSTATDTFVVSAKQTTTLPTGPVTPLLTPVQSPMLNGNSLFQSATLNSANVNINWNPPATGQPYGYVVTVYQLITTSTGQTAYEAAGRYSTSKTSLSVPFLAPSNTFVFTIDALADANATVEKNPNRFKVPNAQAGVVSAPFVIQ